MKGAGYKAQGTRQDKTKFFSLRREPYASLATEYFDFRLQIEGFEIFDNDLPLTAHCLLLDVGCEWFIRWDSKGY